MSRLRTFLALDLGATIRERLVALQEELSSEVPDVKWVEPENLHVTLLFLGEVDARDIVSICRATQEAVTELTAFHLSVDGIGCFPNARRPRVLWVGVGQSGAEVNAVHDAIEEPLLEMGCYRREARAYTPHVTLGRVHMEQPSEALARVLTSHQQWSAGEVMIDEVQIVSSELTRAGPLYTVLGRAKLAS